MALELPTSSANLREGHGLSLAARTDLVVLAVEVEVMEPKKINVRTDLFVQLVACSNKHMLAFTASSRSESTWISFILSSGVS